MGIFGSLISESGVFHHIGGAVFSFIPHSDNVIEGGIDTPGAWSEKTTHHDNAIRSLIVPEGVTGFADGFLTGWAITETVIFPKTLKSIGTDHGHNCFAGCYLPEIILPESVNCLGNYAFGHSYIQKLVIHPNNKSPYRRQFKDSTIKELYLPKEVLELLESSIGGEDYTFYRNFYVHCHCAIIEY